jgi:hypothetical protein
LILNIPLQLEYAARRGFKIRNQPLQPLPSVMVEPCGLQPTASGKPFFKLFDFERSLPTIDRHRRPLMKRQVSNRRLGSWPGMS